MGCTSSKQKQEAKQPEEKEIKKEQLSQTTQDIIKKTVDTIWANYDLDGNGSLDYAEGMKFIKETMESILKDHPDLQSPSQQEVEAAFAEYDKDGDKKIEKSEMEAYLIKTMIG